MVFATSVRVRYAETDQMSVVYYANYLVWFEVGRTQLFRDIGFSYAELERRDVLLPVIEAHCNYKISARYDDVIAIKTRIAEVSAAKIRFEYEISRESDGVLLADGYTVHAFMNKHGKPLALKKKLPDVWQRLNEVMEK